MDLAQNSSKVSTSTGFQLLKSANPQFCTIFYRYRGWDHLWRNFKTKCGVKRNYSETIELQQPYMLSGQQKCRLPIFSLSNMWYFLQQNVQFGAALSHIQSKIKKCLSQERSNVKSSNCWKSTPIRCMLLLPRRTGRLFPTLNQNWVGAIAFKRFQW